MNAEFINSNEPVYSYLLLYFLPDLSDPYFRQDVAQEIEQDERMTYCRYMAAWLPYEPHYAEILNRIAGTTHSTNDKEDAIRQLFIKRVLQYMNYGSCYARVTDKNGMHIKVHTIFTVYRRVVPPFRAWINYEQNQKK